MRGEDEEREEGTSVGSESKELKCFSRDDVVDPRKNGAISKAEVFLAIRRERDWGVCDISWTLVSRDSRTAKTFSRATSSRCMMTI